jgi:hypothetical protein
VIVPEYTKSERRVLREIVGEVYEWELRGALEELGVHSEKAGPVLSNLR